MTTSISMDKRTRDFLARQKKAMEARERRQLTWDEFFEGAFLMGKPPALTRREAGLLKQLVA